MGRAACGMQLKVYGVRYAACGVQNNKDGQKIDFKDFPLSRLCFSFESFVFNGFIS